MLVTTGAAFGRGRTSALDFERLKLDLVIPLAETVEAARAIEEGS